MSTPEEEDRFKQLAGQAAALLTVIGPGREGSDVVSILCIALAGMANISSDPEKMLDGATSLVRSVYQLIVENAALKEKFVHEFASGSVH